MEAGANMTRKERERERHRCDVLAAAERVFARKGYHAATIEEIAKEAEFAIGTLYNLFKGKDDIYTRVIEGVVGEFMHAFETEVLPVEDPAEAIRALVKVRLTLLHEHREFIRIALQAAAGRSLDPAQSLPPHLVEVHDLYLQKVAEIFERGIAAGVFEPGNPTYLSLCLEGITNAFIAFWSRHDDAPLEQRIATLQDEVARRFMVRQQRSEQSP